MAFQSRKTNESRISKSKIVGCLRQEHPDRRHNGDLISHVLHSAQKSSPCTPQKDHSLTIQIAGGICNRVPLCEAERIESITDLSAPHVRQSLERIWVLVSKSPLHPIWLAALEDTHLRQGRVEFCLTILDVQEWITARHMAHAVESRVVYPFLCISTSLSLLLCLGISCLPDLSFLTSCRVLIIGTW